MSCRDLVSKNQQEEALDALLAIYYESDSLILLKSRLQGLKSEQIEGIINSSEYEIRMNKINKAILDIIKVLETDNSKNAGQGYTLDLPKYVDKIDDEMISKIENYLIDNKISFLSKGENPFDTFILSYYLFQDIYQELNGKYLILNKLNNNTSSKTRLELSKTSREIISLMTRLINILEETQNDHCDLYRLSRKLIKEVNQTVDSLIDFKTAKDFKEDQFHSILSVNLSLVKIAIEKLFIELEKIQSRSKLIVMN